MKIGAGRIRFRLFDVHSLKEKRKIVKSITASIRNRFHIAVAETDLNDSHDWAVIGFAVVGNDTRVVNSTVDKVFRMADELKLAMVSDTWMEIIHL